MKEDSCQKTIDICSEKLRRYFHQNSTLPDEIIDVIIRVSKPRKYKKGDFFSKQGELSDKLAYICSGIFSVFSTQEDGKLFVANFLKEGEFVQGAFEVAKPNTLTIQALCDCVVFELSKKVVHDMYLQYPQFGNFARCIVEKYFVIYASHMIQIGTKKAEDNYRLFQKNFQSHEVFIPQHIIAAYLGITPTQLSRIKKQLSGAQQARKSLMLSNFILSTFVYVSNISLIFIDI
jgi:CRP-like cAMP-binding protein